MLRHGWGSGDSLWGLDARSRVECDDLAATSHSAVTPMPGDRVVPASYLPMDAAANRAFAA